MKARIIVPALGSLVASIHAQGTIQLSNAWLPNPIVGGTYDARIELLEIAGEPYLRFPGDRGPGYWVAGLFLEGTTTPLGTTTFYSGTGENSQYNWMFADNPILKCPGIRPVRRLHCFLGSGEQAMAPSRRARLERRVYLPRNHSAVRIPWDRLSRPQ